MASRQQDVARRCPKCAVPMRPVQVEGVALDYCPACMGIWFDRGELSRAAGLKFSDTASGAALARARRTAHRCPSCVIPLYERTVAPDCAVLIDQCPNCSGIFLDRDEFSAVKAYFHSAGAPPAARRGRSEPAPEPVAIDEDAGWLAALQYLTGLPLELDLPQTMFPPAVMALILANVAVLVLAYVEGFEHWVRMLGLVPADIAGGRRLYTLFTSMFMHGGVGHLLGNMYFLYIAGDNIEERFGWHRFLLFYFACGLLGGLALVASDPHSITPCVGASGAIAGVMGAYLVFFPQTTFLMRWILRCGWWHPIRLEIPAYVWFGFWALTQVLFAFADVPGVGWWAHLGGLAAGITVALMVRAREAPAPAATPWQRWKGPRG